MSTNISKLADELKPYFVPWVRKIAQGNGGSAGGGGTPDMVAHVLADTSALGTFHTVSGLTAGQVLVATAATAAHFAQLTHSQLGGVSADQHHAQSHAHDSSDHTGTLAWATVNKTGSSLGHLASRQYTDLQGTGSTYDVVAWTATDTITKRTPSADVSAGGTELLRSNAGLLTLRNINVNNVLQSDSANTVIGVNKTPSGAALDIIAGSAAHHSQRIKQISGQTGRLWRIENTSGQELIVLDSVGNLQSGNPGFTSGLTGWQITPAGNAEFNNGRFRGELHATVMVFDEVSVRNGTELITPAGGSLELDVTLVSTGTPAIRNVRTTAFVDQDYLDYRTDSVTGSGTGITARTIENILSVKNPDTGHYQIFRSGEVLRMKVWTGTAVTDTWMRVNSATDMSTYYAYFVEVMSGTLPVTYRAGSAAAGYGKTGEGAIRLSADDPYGPLIDIFTRGEQPWAGEIYPHVRLGRLDGLGVPGLSGIPQYGIALGSNLADATQPYMFASNLGVRQYNISSAWNDGSNDTVRIEAGGRARFGTNVDAPANTFLDINPALGTATFRGAIEILSGSVPVANVSGLGALATQSDVAWGSQVTGRPTELTDGRVSAGLNSSGYVITKVLPGSNVGTPAGAGLYLGADKLGYFNGSAWKVFMDNAGNFNFGGASGARLAWDGTDLFGTDGSTVQWYARASTGKLYAGAGAVFLDAYGIGLQSYGSTPSSPSLRWLYGTTQVAGMHLRSWYDSGEGVGRDDFVFEQTAAAADTSSLTLRNYNQWNAESIATLEAKGANGTTASIRAYTNGTSSEINITATDFKHGNDKIISARTTAF